PEQADAFWPAVEQITARWGLAAFTQPRFLVLVRALQPLRRSASPRLHTVLARTRAVSRSLIDRGRQLGVVRTDLRAGTLVDLLEALDVVMDDAFRRDPEPPPDSLAAHRGRVMDLIRRLAAPQEEP